MLRQFDSRVASALALRAELTTIRRESGSTAPEFFTTRNESPVKKSPGPWE